MRHQSVIRAWVPLGQNLPSMWHFQGSTWKSNHVLVFHTNFSLVPTHTHISPPGTNWC